MYYRFAKNDTVRTVHSLLEHHSFLAPKVNQEARRSDSPGRVVDHLSETYLVQHEGEIILAVYEECELVDEKAYWVVTHLQSGVPYYKEFSTYGEAQRYIVDLKEQAEADIATSLEGPFYSDKLLQEGPLETKNLYDHLTDDI
jgi:hypothetical protein